VADLKYKLQRLSDYPEIPSTQRLIDPYLPLGGQILLAALPKTFKTYVGLSWACCVATGHKWLGRSVKKGKVLYIALESYYGVLRRKEAWRKKHGHSKADLDNLVCITVPINFAQHGSIDRALADLCAQNFRPDFIVIDT
jgi:RecA-family ATPase